MVQPQACVAEEVEPDSSPIAAAEMIPHPAAETTAPPAAATAAQTQQISDQTGPQHPISGAAAGNQPQMTPQVQDSEPAQVQITLQPHRPVTPKTVVTPHLKCLMRRQPAMQVDWSG